MTAGQDIRAILDQDRCAINGALFKLNKRVEKPDKAMNDEVLGKRLWDELVQLTDLTAE